MTLMDGRTLDIMSDKNGKPVLLSEKVLSCDEDAEDKSSRDIKFPSHLIALGLTTTLDRGDASEKIDKIRILKAMTSMRSIVLEDVNVDWDDKGPLERVERSNSTPEEIESYDLANRTLNGRFAISAWPGAHAQHCVDNYQKLLPEQSSTVLNLPLIASEAPLLATYEVTLMGDINNAAFRHVTNGIPINAKFVRIELHDAEGLCDEEFWELWKKLSTMPNLVHFDMKMGNLSHMHSDAIITHPESGLAAKISMMSKLRVLVLDIEGDTYQHNTCFTEKAVMALGEAINTMFTNTKGAKAGVRHVPLNVLKFDFGGRKTDKKVYDMETAVEIQMWSSSPLDEKYKKPRINHGFGNTLSASEVHKQRTSMHAKERTDIASTAAPGQRNSLFQTLIDFFSGEFRR